MYLPSSDFRAIVLLSTDLATLLLSYASAFQLSILSEVSILKFLRLYYILYVNTHATTNANTQIRKKPKTGVESSLVKGADSWLAGPLCGVLSFLFSVLVSRVRWWQ